MYCRKPLCFLGGAQEEWTVPEAEVLAEGFVKDEQLELIYKTVTDIRKTTQKLWV